MNILLPTKLDQQVIDSILENYVNPGIGGTDYTKIRLFQELSQHTPGLRLHLLSYERWQDILNSNSTLVEFHGLIILITADLGLERSKARQLSYLGVKLVYWSRHPFDLYLYRRSASPSSLFISVGLKQYAINDLMFSNHVYIQNIFSSALIKSQLSTKRSSSIYHHPDSLSVRLSDLADYIVFSGSLLECKGIIHVLKAWKKAQMSGFSYPLIIIGSEGLYGDTTLKTVHRFSHLFEFPISKTLSSKILNAISEDDILSSRVVFLGSLGVERFQIIEKAICAIANPTGESEAFPATILEYMALGKVIIAGSEYGNYDSTSLMTWGVARNLSQLPQLLLELQHMTSEERIEIESHNRLIADHYTRLSQLSLDRWSLVFKSVLESDILYSSGRTSLHTSAKSLLAFCANSLIAFGWNMLKSVHTTLKRLNVWISS